MRLDCSRPGPIDDERFTPCSAPEFPATRLAAVTWSHERLPRSLAAGLPPPQPAAPHDASEARRCASISPIPMKIAIEVDSWKFHGDDNLTAFTVDNARGPTTSW